MPLPGSLSACSASVLCASSLIALMPASKLAPECAALPVISKRMNTPPLRPVTATPGAAARLGVEHRARGAREPLDHRARERRADLLVAGEQRRHRRRRAAEFLERRQHEAVHHQARLHVGDAGAVGAVAFDLERPAGRLALGKDGVAMAHQQDRPVAAGRIVPDGGGDGVAELGVGRDLAGDAVAVEERADVAADRIDAGLVVAAAVGVHQRFQQRQHGVALARQPVEDLLFVFGAVCVMRDPVRGRNLAQARPHESRWPGRSPAMTETPSDLQLFRRFAAIVLGPRRDLRPALGGGDRLAHAQRRIARRCNSASSGRVL